jgi:hypothetical protein
MKQYTCQGFREILPCKKANAAQCKNLNRQSENALHFHGQLHSNNHLIKLIPRQDTPFATIAIPALQDINSAISDLPDVAIFLLVTLVFPDGS